MAVDIVFENPLIYDGTGRQPYRNDVAVKKDRIHAIGDLSREKAKKRIKADQLCLCPGFIDVHSHADMTMHRPDHAGMLEPLVRQGITTFVGGNCGVAMAPVSRNFPGFQFDFYEIFTGQDQHPHIRWQSMGELFDTMESQGMLLNAAVLAPHGLLRLEAMGDAVRTATLAEVGVMEKELERCLDDGAVGMSTGLMYFPGLMSDTWELKALAKVLHRYSGVYTSHLRSYNSDTLGLALEEAVEVGLHGEVPVQVSHLFWIPNFPAPFNHVMKAATKGISWLYNKRPFPLPLESSTKPQLERIAALKSQGMPVGVDAMPTSAGFTHLLAFFPPSSLMGGWRDIKPRLTDRSTRREIQRSIEEGQATWPHRDKDTWSMNLFKVMGWDCAFIMSVVSPKNQSMVGRSLAELARERSQHPFDFACDLLLEEDGKVLVFETATFPGDPLVELSLKGTLLDPNVSIVTDTILQGFGLPSHLFYDCYPKFLGRYSRDEGFLPLSEAIRKCTSLPASQLQIRDRGVVREGCYADMVLFDRNTIGSRGTPQDPAHFPAGIETVMINGQVVVDGEGFHPDTMAGRLLRRGGR